MIGHTGMQSISRNSTPATWFIYLNKVLQCRDSSLRLVRQFHNSHDRNWSNNNDNSTKSVMFCMSRGVLIPQGWITIVLSGPWTDEPKCNKRYKELIWGGTCIVKYIQITTIISKYCNQSTHSGSVLWCMCCSHFCIFRYLHYAISLDRVWPEIGYS